jgi:hypothetical protein
MRDVPNTPRRRGHPAGIMSSKAFYGLLGSSPVLSVGPESASALLVGASVATLGGIRAHIRVLVLLPMEQPEQNAVRSHRARAPLHPDTLPVGQVIGCVVAVCTNAISVDDPSRSTACQRPARSSDERSSGSVSCNLRRARE